MMWVQMIRENPLIEYSYVLKSARFERNLISGVFYFVMRKMTDFIDTYRIV